MTPFRVAACQVRAFDIEDAEANLQNLLRALDEAGAAGAQLTLLPEVSYPAYYVRDANPYARPGVRSFSEIRRLLAAKARQHGYWLAAGIAVPGDDGSLTNSALVFDPNGDLAGRYDKSFLWHFDTTWFRPGRDYPVFDMGFARCGILICADGRMPEIARALTLGGAEIILDLTAWVAWARRTADLDNPQREYMMPVRALENGVWVIAADKCGTEGGTIAYAGRSCVIDPSGATRAMAPADQETVLVFDLDPASAPAIALVPRNPAHYARLAQPTASLPIMQVLAEPLVPAQSAARVAVIPGDGGFDADVLIRRYEALREQDAGVIVAAGGTGPEGWQVSLPRIESAVRAAGGVLVFAVHANGCASAQSSVIVTPEGSWEHQATHGRGILTGSASSPVIESPAGKLAVLCGDEGFVPEVARSLMLEGADVIAWPQFTPHAMAEALARTRADENRVYVATAWPGGGLIVSPQGGVLTAVPARSGLAMTAPVSRALSRLKDMAPCTNVVTNRIPDAYTILLQ
ncbi:MAG: hypothetical protein LC118_08255 [Dehalococcoidia bacterium]|nr:hypothetical protein [Dehalococcoidia bacterium]